MVSITSPAFIEGQMIPSIYTCEGENINPPLEFNGVNQKATGLVLIMDDPDSPGGTWDHWVVWNIPATTMKIKERELPSGAVEGANSFGKIGYGGPCPGSGKHRYVFKLYVVNTKLSLPQGSKKIQVEQAIQGHILDQCQLTGLYQKKNL